MNKIFNYLFSGLCVIGLCYVLIHFASAGTITDFSAEITRHQVNQYADHTLTFTTASAIYSGDTVEIIYAPGFNLLELEIDGYQSIDFTSTSGGTPAAWTLEGAAGSGAGSAVGCDVESQTITFTMNDTDSIEAGAEIEIKIGIHTQDGENQILNPVETGQYTIKIAGTFADTGSLAVPILAADTVPFEGQILPELSFNILTPDQTKISNICAFGIFDSTEVSECSYVLAGSTNAGAGYRIYIESDGPYEHLEDGTDFPYVAEDSTVTAGTNAYGIAVEEPIDTGINKIGDFTDNDTPIPEVQTMILSTDGPFIFDSADLDTATEITHRISIDPNTTLPEGSYSHQIIYSIIASF